MALRAPERVWCWPLGRGGVTALACSISPGDDVPNSPDTPGGCCPALRTSSGDLVRALDSRVSSRGSGCGHNSVRTILVRLISYVGRVLLGKSVIGLNSRFKAFHVALHSHNVARSRVGTGGNCFSATYVQDVGII